MKTDMKALAIITHFTVTAGTTYSAVIEYVDTIARGLERMRDWAGWHGVIERMSVDGRYFDAPDGMTFRLEEIEVDPAQ